MSESKTKDKKATGFPDNADDSDAIFTKLLKKIQNSSPTFAKRTAQALDWFKRATQKFEDKELNPLKIYKTQNRRVLSFAGQIITFKYKPVGSKELPYYDKYPLVLVIKVSPKGFLGLNFHYLHPYQRAMFMNHLYKYLGKKSDQITINMNYQTLIDRNTLAFYKPCIKHYLYKRVSTTISILDPDMWDLALFVPTDQFVSGAEKSHKRKQSVWQESREAIKQTMRSRGRRK